MEKPWRYFWFTLAAILACAIVSAIMSRGSTAVNVGSVADWFSGCMAASAAITALYIANADARRAAQLREDAIAAEKAAARESDTRLMKAVVTLMISGCASLDHIHGEIRRDGDWRGWASAYQLGSVGLAITSGLNEIAVAALHDTKAVTTLVSARNVWAVEMGQIASMAQGSAPTMADGVPALSTDATCEMIDRMCDFLAARNVRFDVDDDHRLIAALQRAFARRANHPDAHAAAA